jgi:hypothetical protein
MKQIERRTQGIVWKDPRSSIDVRSPGENHKQLPVPVPLEITFTSQTYKIFRLQPQLPVQASSAQNVLEQHR